MAASVVRRTPPAPDTLLLLLLLLPVSLTALTSHAAETRRQKQQLKGDRAYRVYYSSVPTALKERARAASGSINVISCSVCFAPHKSSVFVAFLQCELCGVCASVLCCHAPVSCLRYVDLI